MFKRPSTSSDVNYNNVDDLLHQDPTKTLTSPDDNTYAEFSFSPIENEQSFTEEINQIEFDQPEFDDIQTSPNDDDVVVEQAVENTAGQQDKEEASEDITPPPQTNYIDAVEFFKMPIVKIDIKTTDKTRPYEYMFVKANVHAVDCLNNAIDGFISNLENYNAYRSQNNYLKQVGPYSFIVNNYVNNESQFELNLPLSQHDNSIQHGKFFIFTTNQKNIDMFVNELKEQKLIVDINYDADIDPAMVSQKEATIPNVTSVEVDNQFQSDPYVQNDLVERSEINDQFNNNNASSDDFGGEPSHSNTSTKFSVLRADINVFIKTSDKEPGVSLFIKAVKARAVNFLNNFIDGFVSNLEDNHGYCLLKNDTYQLDSRLIDVKGYANETFKFELNISPKRDTFYILSNDEENVDMFVNQLRTISSLFIRITDKRNVTAVNDAPMEDKRASKRQRTEPINMQAQGACRTSPITVDDEDPIVENKNAYEPQPYNYADQLSFFSSHVINIQVKWSEAAPGVIMCVDAANAKLLNIFTQAYITDLEKRHYCLLNNDAEKRGPHSINASVYINNDTGDLFELDMSPQQPGKIFIFTTEERNIDRYIANLRILPNLTLNICDERNINPLPSFNI